MPGRRLPHGITHARRFVGKDACRDRKSLRPTRLVPTRTTWTAGRRGQSKRYGSPTKTRTQARKARDGDRGRGHAAEASPPAAVLRRVGRARWPSTAGRIRPKALSPVAPATEAGPGTCETWPASSRPCTENVWRVNGIWHEIRGKVAGEAATATCEWKPQNQEIGQTAHN